MSVKELSNFTPVSTEKEILKEQKALSQVLSENLGLQQKVVMKEDNFSNS